MMLTKQSDLDDIIVPVILWTTDTAVQRGLEQGAQQSQVTNLCNVT
jgi:hypothetical protein